MKGNSQLRWLIRWNCAYLTKRKLHEQNNRLDFQSLSLVTYAVVENPWDGAVSSLQLFCLEFIGHAGLSKLDSSFDSMVFEWISNVQFGNVFNVSSLREVCRYFRESRKSKWKASQIIITQFILFFRVRRTQLFHILTSSFPFFVSA